MIPTPPAIVCSAPLQKEINEERVLACIRLVEGSPANPYGISEAVRMQHRIEVREGTEHDYAIAHLQWIEGQILIHRYQLTVYNIALCWNAGVTGAARIINGRHYSAKVMDYADRVNNLYNLPDQQL